MHMLLLFRLSVSTGFSAHRLLRTTEEDYWITVPVADKLVAHSLVHQASSDIVLKHLCYGTEFR